MPSFIDYVCVGYIVYINLNKGTLTLYFLIFLSKQTYFDVAMKLRFIKYYLVLLIIALGSSVFSSVVQHQDQGQQYQNKYLFQQSHGAFAFNTLQSRAYTGVRNSHTYRVIISEVVEDVTEVSEKEGQSKKNKGAVLFASTLFSTLRYVALFNSTILQKCNYPKNYTYNHFQNGVFKQIRSFRI